MELILDTGNIEEIKEYDQFLNVSGVTTNPTIITKSGKSPEAVISDLVDYLRTDQKIFIQVVATDFEGIMEEARYIASLRPENMYVKIPVHRAGLQAVKACHEEGIHTLATAIYSADSGFMAAVNGADYLAPYVNRMSNYGDGVAETIDLIEMLRVQNSSTKVVAASFHSVNQVHQLIPLVSKPLLFRHRCLKTLWITHIPPLRWMSLPPTGRLLTGALLLQPRT